MTKPNKKKIGIFLRTFSLFLILASVVMALFALVTIPWHRNTIIKSVESHAKSISASIAQISGNAIVSEDYSFIVDHCLEVLKGNADIFYIVVVRHDGFSLIHTANNWEQREKPYPEWEKIQGQITKKDIVYSELVQKRVFHHSFPLNYSGIDWGWIHLGLSLDSYNKDLKNMYKKLLALGLFCLAIATVGAYFFARRLTIPLISLRQVTEQVAEGNLDTRSEISTGDEVEDLAESFNEMTKSLQKSTIELTTANKQLEQEITERKLVEEALRIEKEFTEFLINSSADGILAFDKDCRYTVWNKGMERISGLGRAQTLGKCAFDVFPFLKEIGEDRYFFETLSGKNVVAKERSYRIHENGQKGFFEGYYSPLYNASDEVIGGLAIIIDITKRKIAEEELKESEEKHRRLIENLQDNYFFYVRNADGIFTYISPSVTNMLGYSVEEFLTHYSEYLTDNPINKEVRKHSELSTKGIRQLPYEVEIYHNDCSIRLLQVQEVPIFDENRKVIAVEGIAQDITERKKAEEQITASLREKEILLQEIHHRVKNNLQVIVSLLRLQSKNIKDQTILQMFQESQDRISSMSLVHEKIYRSKDLARIKLKGYVEDLANDLFRNYGVNNGKIALKIDVEDISIGIDTAIPCGLIINELLTNSLKYAFPEGRKGEIKIEISPTNEDEIEMIIGDNGIGLREEFDYRNSPGFGFRMIVDLVEYKLMGRINPIHNEGMQFQILFKEIRYKERI